MCLQAHVLTSLRQHALVLPVAAGLVGIVVAWWRHGTEEAAEEEHLQEEADQPNHELVSLLEANRQISFLEAALPEDAKLGMHGVRYAFGVQMHGGWLANIFWIRDRANMQALSVRVPRFSECTLTELLRFLTQAGVCVVVGDNILLYEEEVLRRLAEDNIHRWEYYRFRVCMDSIRDPGLRSRALLRVLELTPLSTLQREAGRARGHMEVLPTWQRNMFEHNLPFHDRLYIQAGGLDDGLDTCFRIMDSILVRQRQRKLWKRRLLLLLLLLLKVLLLPPGNHHGWLEVWHAGLIA
ncbi:hypothetical protein N2152v2_000714 [Parachlorella kessleri]